MCSAKGHVRFTPESGHVQCNKACPLCANSGHRFQSSRMDIKRDRLVSAPSDPFCDPPKVGTPRLGNSASNTTTSVRWIDLAVRLITLPDAMRLFVTPSTPRYVKNLQTLFINSSSFHPRLESRQSPGGAAEGAKCLLFLNWRGGSGVLPFRAHGSPVCLDGCGLNRTRPVGCQTCYRLYRQQ